MAAVAIFAGCNKSEPGGPGATGRAGTPHAGAPDSGRVIRGAGDHDNTATPNKNDTFTIHAPATSTTIKQGESNTVKIKVDRGSAFKQDVRLSFEAPQGITIEPSTATVKASEDETHTFTLKAAPNAPLGEESVKVIGTPQTGKATDVTFKVKVEKK